MREEEILRALEFLKSAPVKDVPFEDRAKFLQEKLTQEELNEVKRRYQVPQTGQPVQMVQSRQTAARLESTNNHFSIFTAINVASLAVLTTIGVNMMLDTIKEKKDASLREEIKDRLHQSLSENQKRIQNLESELSEIKIKVCDTDEVEEIIKKRFDQYETNQTLTDVKNKTLSLKVRAQPNQRMNEHEPIPDERQQLLHELKQMREDFAKVNKSNAECIDELRQINRQLLQGKLPSPVEQQSADSGQLQIAEQPVQEVASLLSSAEVSVDQQMSLARSVDTFISAFESKESQTLAMTRITMPLAQIVKQPEQEKWRTIQTSNTLLRPVVQNKQEAVNSFLVAIGYKKEKEMVFKYQAPGNIKELELVIELLKERTNTGKLQILEVAEPVEEVIDLPSQQITTENEASKE